MKYLINKKTKEHRVSTGPIYPAYLDGWAVVEADSEGWIKHDGGECPLPDGASHKVKFRSGCIGGDDSPETWAWGHDGVGDDIIAYHPILDSKPEFKFPEWDSSLTYKDGDKFTFNGQVVTIGDVAPDNLEAKPTTKKSLTVDLIARLKAAHKAANELPDLVAELRAQLEPLGLGVTYLSELDVCAEPEASVDTQQSARAKLKLPPELQFEARCLYCGAGNQENHKPYCHNFTSSSEDMTDWRNWRDGDLVTVHGNKGGYRCYEDNEAYEVMLDDERLGVHVKNPRGYALFFAEEEIARGELRFHSRPSEGK